MKIDKIPDSIDPRLDLEKVREECLQKTKKRAYLSAGAAIVPIPFFDVAVDLGMLSQIIPEINSRFGLGTEHVSVFNPETKQVHWDELRKRGFEFSGFVVARTAMKGTFNGFFTKIATKQVTKFIPLGGQIVAASLGYFMMSKITEAHIEDCYKLAKQIQQKSHNTIVA